MPTPARVFLDWSEPVAPAAARWLKARPLDEMLVLVPTRQARRRLRAEFSAAAPRIVTPADFLPPAGDDLADPLESELALAAELAAPLATRSTALFPSGVPARSFAERLALARRLRRLQGELAEHDLLLSEAATRLTPGSAEAARWRALARLAEAADARLARAGRRHRETAWLESARAASPDAREIAVVAAADLPLLASAALERFSGPVTVLVSGPVEPDAFDAWGRPRPAAWNERDPGWRDFSGQVRLVSRPDAREEISVEPADGLVIGLLDRELLPGLHENLAARGVALHDPTGRPLAAHWLARTLEEFAALDEDPAFDRAANLLRNGAVRAWLAGRAGSFDADAALLALDAVRLRHFPATLRAARAWAAPHPPLSEAFATVEQTLADLRADPLSACRRLARELAEAFAPFLEPDESSALTDALAAVEQIFDRLAWIATPLSAPDWLCALTDAFAEERLYPDRPARAVEALGWLELPWSDAPRVLLAGLNLGRLPVPIGSEIFLTAGVRRALGLPGADDRLARDAYFLAQILARAPHAAALVLQADAQGSPLQPSPLLFNGAGDALPARVERLFGEAGPPRPDPAWAAGWTLDPPVRELPRTMAATDFERYLDCPFTFYLRRAAGMRPFDPAAEELDAAQFGELIHYALENWSRDESASRSADAAAIARALDAHVADWARRHVGRALSLPLRVQLDSARARLAAFAEWQAADARDGWRIRRVETNFHDLLGRPWELDGWTINGRVDRLDENERDGRWRVVDYKTFDAPDDPAKKHLRAFRTADRAWPPGYARVPGSPQWWINLQLPLYRQLLVESGRPAEAVAAGYFNLPKTISETGLRLWDTLDDALQASALACARGVLADVARRRFWPSNPRAAHAEFAEFFPPDAARVVDPAGAFVASCAP